jgi:MOSC domain-containing protein YiiM
LKSEQRPAVVAVSISDTKGEKKHNVDRVRLKIDHGVEGDAHAGDWHRQVSLLALESIDKMQGRGLEVKPGDFAENITTMGLDVAALPVGARIRIGPDVVLELTQIGKKCHAGCAIMQQVGDCVMPREGVFFKVITGGEVAPGDEIVVI